MPHYYLWTITLAGLPNHQPLKIVLTSLPLTVVMMMSLYFIRSRISRDLFSFFYHLWHEKIRSVLNLESVGIIKVFHKCIVRIPPYLLGGRSRSFWKIEGGCQQFFVKMGGNLLRGSAYKGFKRCLSLVIYGFCSNNAL